MPHAFGDHDEIPDDRRGGVGPAGHNDLAFEYVKPMLGVRMEVEGSPSGHLEIVQARFGRGIKRPETSSRRPVGRTIGHDLGAMNNSGRAIALLAMACDVAVRGVHD